MHSDCIEDRKTAVDAQKVASKGTIGHSIHTSLDFSVMLCSVIGLDSLQEVFTASGWGHMLDSDMDAFLEDSVTHLCGADYHSRAANKLGTLQGFCLPLTLMFANFSIQRSMDKTAL